MFAAITAARGTFTANNVLAYFLLHVQPRGNLTNNPGERVHGMITVSKIFVSVITLIQGFFDQLWVDGRLMIGYMKESVLT